VLCRSGIFGFYIFKGFGLSGSPLRRMKSWAHRTVSLYHLHLRQPAQSHRYPAPFSSFLSPRSNHTSPRNASRGVTTGVKHPALAQISLFHLLILQHDADGLIRMALKRNKRGGRPSPYPRFLFHGLRSAQLLSSVVVSGIMCYFMYYLRSSRPLSIPPATCFEKQSY
jgi:hypothetical protein